VICHHHSQEDLVALNIFSNSEFIWKACITMSSGNCVHHAKTNNYEKMTPA